MWPITIGFLTMEGLTLAQEEDAAAAAGWVTTGGAPVPYGTDGPDAPTGASSKSSQLSWTTSSEGKPIPGVATDAVNIAWRCSSYVAGLLPKAGEIRRSTGSSK